MIPREIFMAISPGASNSELREIAAENGLTYSEVWEARDARKRFYARGVDTTIRRDRWKK